MAAISCCLCSRTVHALLRQGEGPLPRQGEGQKGRKRLGQQPNHVTSGSARYNDSFSLPNETHNRTDSLPIVRAIAAHHGHLPPGHNLLLSGPVNAANRIAWDKPSGKYKGMQKYLLDESYGKDPFLHEYVRGEASATACETAIINWSLEAQKAAIVPAGETDAACMQRVTNGKLYEAAICELRNDVKLAYKLAREQASDVLSAADFTESVSKPSSLQVVRASAERTFYHVKQHEEIPSA